MFQWLRTRRGHLRHLMITTVVLGGLGVLALTQLPATKTAPRRAGPPVSGNAYPLAATLISPTTDLKERMRRLPEVLQYAEFELPPGTAAGYSQCFEFQILAKLAWTESLFLLLEGRRTESLALQSAVFYLGHLIAEDGHSLHYRCGTLIMSVSSYTLGLQALNTGETPADRKLMWDTLEDLDARSSPPDWREYKRKFGLLGGFLISDELKEWFLGRQHFYAKFQLLRAAVAAQDRMATSGNWPVAPTDFAPFLRGGPPADPFAKPSASLRYAPAGTRDFVLWSVGPDERNDGAAIIYDPTNGTISGGDLVLEVPRTGKYDLPSSGTALTAAELHSRFPHGLPQDPFSYTRGRGLSVSTQSTGTIVYSFGLNTDEARTGGTGLPDMPEVQYDPTNGTMSDGDILRVWSP